MIDVSLIKTETVNGKTRYSYEVAPGAIIEAGNLGELLKALVAYVARESEGENE